MSIFSRIREGFRRATQSTTAATNRNQNRNQDTPKTGTGRVVDNLLTDIAISFGRLDASDVGQSGIDDYNRRTEQSRQAMKDLQERNQRDRDSGSNKNEVVTPVVETVEEKEETPVTPVTPTDDPVELTPVGGSTTTAGSAEEEADILEDGATGDAEKDVADTIRKRGRRRNIATSAQGLLSQAPTRRRRSLMGGGLLR